MYFTNDQYVGLSQLERWYHKYEHQFIEISGVTGTGAWDMVQSFISSYEFDPREIMYLSYDQKQVLEMAYKRYHAYYINGIIYKYRRETLLESLPVINPHASGVLEYKWIRSVRKKIDPRYKLIVVFDSLLLSHETLKDIASFGLPVILIRDPMLLPSLDTYTFLREPNIELREVNPVYERNPLTYFTHRLLLGEPLKPGAYDSVTIVPRRQMNLHNLKASDMNIALSPDLRKIMNRVYRERIIRAKDTTTQLNEKLIVTEDLHAHKIVNPDEKNVKVYLTKGTVGRVSRINKHAVGTKYVSMDFKPEFYHEAFEDLYLDRHALNEVDSPSRQMIPDEIFKAEYAYVLTPELARYSHWDKGTIILDRDEIEEGGEIEMRLLYTAISRIKRSMTIVV